MREIKFRAWVTYRTDHRWEWAYKEAEKLHLDYEETAEKRDLFLEEWDKEHSQDERYSHKEYMTNWDEVSISLSGNLVRLINLDVLDIMQFTGLKDKNGNEIYEGDILQISSACLPEFAGQPVAVVFEMGGFRDSYYKWILDGKQYGFAVIGNVYENPEMTRL